MKLTWGRYNQFNLDTAKTSFLNKIEIDPITDCWIWKGSIANCKRYGSVGIGGKSYLAHRASFWLFNNINPGEKCVCHKCDNGFCVNPQHLFLGSQKDNVLDMESKKRSVHPKCESHGRAKLNKEQVLDIRNKHKLGKSIRCLAKEYSMSRPTISRIVNNKGWIYQV